MFYEGGLFIVVSNITSGSYGFNGNIYTSRDGLTWTWANWDTAPYSITEGNGTGSVGSVAYQPGSSSSLLDGYITAGFYNADAQDSQGGTISVSDDTFEFNLTTFSTDEIIVVMVTNSSSDTYQTVVSITGGGLVFQKRASANIPSGVLTQDDTTGSIEAELWWAYAASTLPDVTFTITMSGTIAVQSIVAFGVTGCTNFTDPWDPNTSLPSVVATNSTPASAPMFSTSQPNSLLLAFSISNTNTNSVTSFDVTGGDFTYTSFEFFTSHSLLNNQIASYPILDVNVGYYPRESDPIPGIETDVSVTNNQTTSVIYFMDALAGLSTYVASGNLCTGGSFLMTSTTGGSIWTYQTPGIGIAFNAAADLGNNGSSTNSLTTSYTVGNGSNRMLFVTVTGSTSVNDVTGVTYNGVNMTSIWGGVRYQSGTHYIYGYYLLNPASGANDVVVSATTNHYIAAGAADYTGVAQTGQPNVSTSIIFGTTSSITLPIVPTLSSGWAIISCPGSNGNPPVAGDNNVLRAVATSDATWGIFDSNAPLPGKNYSFFPMTTTAGSFDMYCIGAVFAPANVYSFATLSKVAYGNGLFVTTAYTPETESLPLVYLTSPDGATWTSRNFPSTFGAVGQTVYVSYVNNTFVAAISNGVLSPPFYAAAFSTDGITWQVSLSDARFASNDSTLYYDNDYLHLASRFLSEDEKTFSTIANPLGISQVKVVNGMLLLIGNSNGGIYVASR